MAASLDQILEPGWLGGLEARPLADVRAMRDDCQVVEGGLSFTRRVVQGRLDIVGAELTRRRQGGDPADLSALVAQLPELLTEHQSGGAPRSPRLLEVTTVPEDLQARLDGIVDTDELADLREVDTAELEGLAERLDEFERWVSERRHTVQGVLDRLQGEIARRYRDGEASVDSLLG